MSEKRPRRRRRWLIAVAVSLVVLVVAAAFARLVVLRDDARAVTTGEAVDRYRDEVGSTPVGSEPVASSSPAPSSATVVTVADLAPATTATSKTTVPPSVSTSPSTSASRARPTTEPAKLPALVAPGVYRYATTGRESIDALDGATHTYPSETTITVLPAGCGVSVRWDALKERWDEWQLCATVDGIEIQPDGTQYHEFFGQPDDEAVVCTGTVLLLPRLLASPPPARQSCMLAEDPWLPSWEVAERSTRRVGGREVEVRHIVMRIDDPDEYWEHTQIDWYLAPDGLPVEVTATKASLSPSPIGPVEYREEYHLLLVSLSPLR